MKTYHIKYFLPFLYIILESCFFGGSTFKDIQNYVLTDSMIIINTSPKEKLTAIKIYVDTVPLFTGKHLILDTTFALPIDRYLIPFSKDSLNTKYVDIFIKMSRPPQLSISIVPGELVKKRKILFEGDKY